MLRILVLYTPNPKPESLIPKPLFTLTTRHT